MTHENFDKAVLAKAALNLFPPLIRYSLLSDQDLMEEYGLKAEPIIALGANEVSFKQSHFFQVIRAFLTDKSLNKVTDVEQRDWHLTYEAQQSQPTRIVLSSDDRRFILPDFSILSPDISARIRFLEASATDVNLPLYAHEKWRKIIERRALEDHEVEAYHHDLRDTPEYVAQTIRNEVMNGEGSLSTLIPNSRRYFERLVGIYDGSHSIGAYAIGAARKLVECHSNRKPYEGFLSSLFISSHQALSSEIKADLLDSNELEKAFMFLSKHGDLISCIGALEVGLRILPDKPVIEPFLLLLVCRIRDAEEQGSQFTLLSSLFILVDGEMARIRLFTEAPPFYRRLASLAHASLIHRQLLQCEIDHQNFSEWAVNNRITNYYMQTLADMRIEPRWNPDLVDSPQIKADFFGRIIIAANALKEKLGEGELRNVILGDGAQSLRQQCDFLSPFFPGPLEGAEDTLNSQNILPDDIAQVINQELDSSEVEASSFVALVNSAMIFRISTCHADLAAKALRIGNYTLANPKDKSQLVGILNGLATVAAISRSTSLADELRILVRRYRRDAQYSLSAQEAMRIYLVAAAARSELAEWSKYVGESMIELAFSDFKDNEAVLLYSSLLALLHSVPHLWISCARAEAALEACCS